MVNCKCNVKNNTRRGYVFMLPGNERDLNKFVAEKRRNDISERTIETCVRFVTELDETINKEFREVTEDDINRFVDMKASYCNKKTMVLCKVVLCVVRFCFNRHLDCDCKVQIKRIITKMVGGRIFVLDCCINCTCIGYQDDTYYS
jgi:hypothetical protein